MVNSGSSAFEYSLDEGWAFCARVRTSIRFCLAEGGDIGNYVLFFCNPLFFLANIGCRMVVARMTDRSDFG